MKNEVDVAIIGAGTAGLFALSQVRKVTGSYVLINGGELGTTCARVGCMPSKAAIQVAEDFQRRKLFDRQGIEGADKLSLDIPAALEHVQDLRDVFVDKVLSSSTDEMGDELIAGYAAFLEPNLLAVNGEEIRAKKIIIATGSRPYIPPAWQGFRDRIFTTDEIFEQEDLPESLAVIGLGVIGLEMGQALSRVGVEVTGIDKRDHIGGLQDPVANEQAIDILRKEFPLWLGTEPVVKEHVGKFHVTCGEQAATVDRLFVSIGRVPNLERLGLEKLGVETDERGIPRFNPHTLQLGELPIFIAGDVTGHRPLLHEAAEEGRIAGFNAVQDSPVEFQRRTPLTIVFSEPNIATVGRSWSELEHDAIAIGEVKIGLVGRALIMGKNRGILRLYADKSDGRILGATLVMPKGENIAHLLGWAIEQNLTVWDLLKMPFYHPTIEEALQAALYDLAGKLERSSPEPVELRRLSI